MSCEEAVVSITEQRLGERHETMSVENLKRHAAQIARATGGESIASCEALSKSSKNHFLRCASDATTHKAGQKCLSAIASN